VKRVAITLVLLMYFVPVLQAKPATRFLPLIGASAGKHSAPNHESTVLRLPARLPIKAPEITAAGDIARPRSPGRPQRATAALIERLNPAAALTLGDNQYERGAQADFNASYDPSWGQFKAKTYPVPGNHDHYTAGAAGYFAYFGARAHGRTGWYSYDLGPWHLVALDSVLGGAPPRAELRFLRRDLSADRHLCQLAYFHHPLFSSGNAHGGDHAMRAFWTILQAHGVDVVLNGHDHDYERFARMLSGGMLSTRGIREFVVGTGGAGIRTFSAPVHGSQVRLRDFGVLRMRLLPTGYRFQFIRTDGRVLDQGMTSCH
jgi:3',5'-cyclic AMP phosphodiesterase CpdA